VFFRITDDGKSPPPHKKKLKHVSRSYASGNKVYLSSSFLSAASNMKM
jgi:hypothetical protein